MKAVVIRGPNDLRIEEVSKPAPGPGEVVCQVAAAGICATDIEIYHGQMPYFEMGMLSFPWTPGHEWSGVVESVGEGVTHLKPGDRVVGECSIPCGRCEPCYQGSYHLCLNRTEVGITGRFPGAFAEYVLMPAAQTMKVPDNVSLREAAMTEPAGVAVHGLDHLKIKPGETVVVLGDGTIGLLAAQVAVASGGSPVVLLGDLEYRMKIARQVGLKHIISRHEMDAGAKIIAALGGTKTDYLIEATGNPNVLDFASSLIKMGGKCLVISFYPTNQLTFNFNNFVANEIHMLTTISAVNCYPRVLDLMQSKRINVLPMQSPYYTLDRARDAFEDVAHRRTGGVKTLIVNEKILD